MVVAKAEERAKEIDVDQMVHVRGCKHCSQTATW